MEQETTTIRSFKPIADFMQWLEARTEYETAVRWISGGFAIAELDDTENPVDLTINLKWGVKSDCEDYVYTEHLSIPKSVIYDQSLTNMEKYKLSS
jgi:hypothetical protein